MRVVAARDGDVPSHRPAREQRGRRLLGDPRDGALLGVAGAYVALTATYSDDLGYLGRIPVLYLVLLVVGVPWAAVAAGWLLSGREPPAIARTVIE